MQSPSTEHQHGASNQSLTPGPDELREIRKRYSHTSSQLPPQNPTSYVDQLRRMQAREGEAALEQVVLAEDKRFYVKGTEPTAACKLVGDESALSAESKTVAKPRQKCDFFDCEDLRELVNQNLEREAKRVGAYLSQVECQKRSHGKWWAKLTGICEGLDNAAKHFHDLTLLCLLRLSRLKR